MKFALVNGERLEAQFGLTGDCPGCQRPMIAKCGQIKVPHWAHSGKRVCDPWWENETEWHRHWKGLFPKDWQEVVQLAEGGEKHIADIKTDQGYVIEFQHSSIKPEERQARENFYKDMIWIVDGKRRIRDRIKFMEAWDWATCVGAREDLRENLRPGPLLRDWSGGSVTVLFDFGEEHLWGVLPKTAEGKMYGFKVERNALIDALRRSDIDGLLKSLKGAIHAYEWRLKREREQLIDPLMSLYSNYYSRRRF